MTRGAQRVGAEPVAPALAQAPLWGLGRAIALEHPEIWGGLIDLDPAASDADGRVLVDAILGHDGEDQVAVRQGERRVPRLVPSADPPGTAPVRSDATYLITGGLGRLGLLVARWLVECGARHLALVSRTFLPGRAAWESVAPTTAVGTRIAAIRALEAAGASVDVIQADVGDATRMTTVLRERLAGVPPLRGVVHAAGVVLVTPLRDTDLQTVSSAFQAKVLGAWILHRLTEDLDLDFFVLFSSAAAVWGSRGLAAYAAANQFLDVLAHHRRRLGRTALSVGWGWWDEGATASPELAGLFAEVGLCPMATGPALGVLGTLSTGSAAHRVVVDVEWTTFKALYEARARRRLLDEIGGAVAAGDRDGSGVKRPDLVRRLTEAPAETRMALVRAHVQSAVAQALGFEPADTVDPRQGFFKLGMTSLIAVDLRRRLEHSLGRSLPPTLAFEYPTIDALARHLAVDVLRLEATPRRFPQERDREAIPTPSAASMSEDELTARLVAKLREIE